MPAALIADGNSQTYAGTSLARSVEMSPDPLFRIARIASTGRLAIACALQLHHLLNTASGSIVAAAKSSPAAAQLRDVLGAAGDITRQLLTAAHRPPTETTMVELCDLVEEMRELLAILAGPGAIVVIVRDAARVRTFGNRGDLEQILLNLVEIPCISASRRVTITCGVADWPGGVSATGRTLAAGRYATLSMTDDRQTDVRPVDHTCARCGGVPELGLPLADAIASVNGGGLVVVNAPDGNVEHRVLLPIAQM